MKDQRRRDADHLRKLLAKYPRRATEILAGQPFTDVKIRGQEVMSGLANGEIFLFHRQTVERLIASLDTK